MKVQTENTFAWNFNLVDAMNMALQVAAMTGHRASIKVIKFRTVSVHGTLFVVLGSNETAEHHHHD